VKSGSTVELHVWQGMLHVFPADVALLHAAREALDLAGDFLRRISPVERRATP
jgi:monoterpene epsilon-lactone hydrolase